MSRQHSRLFILSSVAVAVLAACGGGGGGGDTPSPPLVPLGPTAPLPVAVSGSTVMSCVDGANFQCSGATILRTDNGVSITSSGVQASGRSTTDQSPNNPNLQEANGLEPFVGGVAELRLQRNATTRAVTRAGMILTNFDVKWDNLTDRPPAIEVFEDSQGFTELDTSGALSWISPPNVLPPPTKLDYYNYAGLSTRANKENYANNRYFPRDLVAMPLRNCPWAPADCTRETKGITYTPGPFRTTGTDPDVTSGHRLHSDGDVNAGYRPGVPTVGVPYPGNKGYRDLQVYSFDYANLGAWFSKETARIDEWELAGSEFSTNRLGAVAFGATTNPTVVPEVSGANYQGVAYGWYTSNGVDVVEFRGAATMSVNFDTRQVAVQLNNAVNRANPATAVPFTFVLTTGLGAKGSNVANYFTGSANTADTQLGLGGRFFGPVAPSRVDTTSGPAEIGGSFSFRNSTTKAAAVGGFVARLR